MLLIYCLDPGILLGVLRVPSQPLRTSLCYRQRLGSGDLRLVPSCHFYQSVQRQ